MTPVSSFKALVRRSWSVFFLSVLFAGASHAAPTLTVEIGILTGASGVNVGGVLYDVKFKGGTCLALFSGCDSASDFVFQSSDTATAASQALLAQVFLGKWDDRPEQTAGCLDSATCRVSTPYAVTDDPSNVDASYALNRVQEPDEVGSIKWTRSDDLRPDILAVWAVWSPSAAAPEPSSLALLGLAGVALGWSQRRRRHRAMALAQ